MPGVLLLTAMDTRGEETVFLKGLIEALGREVILLDVAMRRHGFEGADYTCAEVARAGGDDFDRISAQKGTSEIIGPMRKGAIAIARRLYRQGAISAIAGMGGTSNTLLASSVMAALPFGFPKCILCSSAAVPAYAARFFADRDIAVLHACVEINGLNPILNEVLRQFAGMVTGMAGVARVEANHERRMVAISGFQFSEGCARRVRERCASGDFDLVPFHAQGVGDRIMEEMVVEGVFQAVVDLVPAGLSEAILGGNRAAGTDRLDRELRAGVPVILTPCGFDSLSCGPYTRRHTDSLWKTKRLAGRRLYIQDELRVQARTTRREMS
jgi:uncharacterized protein (UPF0261 family)